MRFLLFSSFAFILFSKTIHAQGCCSGGSGSPIAGGTSQGVLSERQMEVNANYQYIDSKKFYTGDRDTAKLFDDLNSNYLYLRLAYGLSKNLTMSVESGYFINKTQIGLNKRDTITSSGIGDLILFPRYTVFSKNEETKRTEITLGLGFKIPLGKYDDSTVTYIDRNGKKYYTPSPPSVQASTGSHDFIFYGFFYRGYPEKNFRIFMNALYVKKGWNPIGEKFGDYASVGLFAGKTFFKKLGVTLQVKGEWIGKMKANRDADEMNWMYNVDILSTGGRKVLFVPQLSYSIKKFTVFALSEFPVYQYVNRAQVASQYQVTAGITYRFMIKKSEKKEALPVTN